MLLVHFIASHTLCEHISFNPLSSVAQKTQGGDFLQAHGFFLFIMSLSCNRNTWDGKMRVYSLDTLLVSQGCIFYHEILLFPPPPFLRNSISSPLALKFEKSFHR